ncbi:MAG: glycosyltransferase family 2 protein [Phycisphaerales bacterium]|nr:glycosyltransferase family 2 protein [Phycisphaerales bacterium]
MTTQAAQETTPTSAPVDAQQRALANVSVIIPTFNEELNLPHALKSVVDKAQQVFVVDSESTDRTQSIAEDFGATVVVRPWLGYAAQKNWALDNLPIETDWVFILDADESITPELWTEIEAITRKPAHEVAAAGYYVNRLTYFMGRPIRHCGFFPSYNLRFFKLGAARYEDRSVHEHMVVQGATARLKHLMLHEDRRGLEHFIAKHNRYSTLEARELVKGQRTPSKQKLERGIAFRRWLKYHVLPKLPISGVWRFFYMYFFRLGFLDGITGLRFCVTLSIYDMLISLKMAELRRAGIKDVEKLAPAVRALAVEDGALGTQVKTAAPARQEALIDTALAKPSNIATIDADEKAKLAEEQAAATVPPLPEPRHALADELEVALEPRREPEGDWPAYRSVKVSVLIPVKNEQRNLIGCLRHLRWADELVVVDSQSTDKTIPIAQAMGADVYQFYYSKAGWPKKKNWGLEHVPWRNEWVLILDADEYMTPELAREVERVVNGAWKANDPSKAGCGDGYWINRRFMFMGRWIKGCGYYPSWNVRLLKHKVGRYERIGTLGDTGSGDNEVHEHITLSTGDAGYLKEEFLHYAYPNLSAWVEKHDRYTTWEAHAMNAKDEGDVTASLFGGPIQRRRWLKRFSRKLPFRPTLRFMYGYVFQRGFMDGYPGFVMCRLLAWYELMSIAKHREMQTPNAQCEQRNR